MFVNAGIRDGIGSLRIMGSRIASMNAPPEPGDVIVDLKGDRLLPGLINAHDHVQLNNFGPLKYRDRYANVRDWITDVSAHMRTSRTLKACNALPRDQRLLFGAMKNILSGVTTVAHHDPLYEFLTGSSSPVRAVEQYGWSHSLLVDGEERVRNSYRQTPAAWPWIIHAAEGTDDEAAAEFCRLHALGCVGDNTLIVHGVALDRAQKKRLAAARAGLIWCPASNLHLFGETADVMDLIEQGKVALGSDSRLSGGRDLLSELHVASRIYALDDSVLESLVTINSARLLRLADRGVLGVGAAADILILPRDMPLATATRADVRLVMVQGRMMYGDASYAELVAPASSVAITVDDRPKAMDHALARAWGQSGLHEPGLRISETAWRAA